ncbi:MAG: hypothetical protein AABY27_06310 [Pseudomonadota bacterium]
MLNNLNSLSISKICENILSGLALVICFVSPIVPLVWFSVRESYLIGLIEKEKHCSKEEAKKIFQEYEAQRHKQAVKAQEEYEKSHQFYEESNQFVDAIYNPTNPHHYLYEQ